METKTHDMRGRAAIVTGAAGAVGRASVAMLAERGANVLAVDLERSSVGDLARRGSGAGDVVPVFADVTDEDDVRSYVRAALDEFGRIDFFFNNAGISEGSAPLIETAVDLWSRTLDVNLTGAFLGLREVLSVMVAAGRGSVVNTASITGTRGLVGAAPYCASKHGLLGLSATAALEAAPAGVRVNAICPGPIDTPLLRADSATNPVRAARIDYVSGRIPLGRLGQAEEVASLALWLLSDEASFVTGAAYAIDGGMAAQV